LDHSLFIWIDSLLQKISENGDIKQNKNRKLHALVIGKIVFWSIMLFFIASAANLLGWKIFPSWIKSSVTYLLNIVTGILIIIVGLFIGNVTKAAVISGANTDDKENNFAIARLLQFLVILISIIVATEQIGVNMQLLSNLLVTITGILLFGISLAFGLGAKTLVENIIGSQFARKYCRLGEEIQINKISGIILEITRTSIILNTREGRSIIPAKHFHEQFINFSYNSDNLNSTLDEEN
jgi:hypothetical protein